MLGDAETAVVLLLLFDFVLLFFQMFCNTKIEPQQVLYNIDKGDCNQYTYWQSFNNLLSK